MLTGIILQFALASLLPVAATAALVAAQQKGLFAKVSFASQQVLIGILFGAIAIFGTEFGIDVHGATMNVRDAAPITAGLVFGGPAGIIAGLIGGVERWFAVLWGRGVFTRVGCSVATIVVGLLAAGLRRFVFENKKPWWVMGLATGVVGEVFHLTLIFFTNIDEMERALNVVRACTGPMVSCTGISVMLAVIVATLMCHEPLWDKPEKRGVALAVQAGMIVCVLLGFFVTMGLTFMIQTGVSNDRTTELLSVNVDDAGFDITSRADESLMRAASSVAHSVGTIQSGESMDLSALADENGVCQIDLVDTQGVVVRSTKEDFVGFHMDSDERTSEFMPLLGTTGGQISQERIHVGDDDKAWYKFAGVGLSDGFVRVCYDEMQMGMQVAMGIATTAQSHRVGESGGIIVVDSDDWVLGARDQSAGSTLDDIGIKADVDKAAEGRLFRTKLQSVPVFALYKQYEGYRIIAEQPVDEAHFSRNASMLIIAFMEVLVFAALFIVIYFMVKRTVVDNVHQINDTLGTICEGEMDAVVDVRTSVEFDSLSTRINQTVSALNFAIEEAVTRFETELEYARTIQRSALPMVFPPYPSRTDFDVFASMDAAKEVGGDFYDFYLLDDEHLAFVVADVSGKGIPGALFMMTAKTMLKNLLESGLPVQEAMAGANDRLCQNNEAEMFVTVWMGVLDLATGHVTYANAGHNPPVLVRGDSDPEFVRVRPNMVLAGMEGIPYRAHELDLNPGDMIMIYTDGVTEATDANNQLFGDERLLQSVSQHRMQDVASLCRSIRSDVDAFVGEAPQFDDITMLALRYWGGISREA